MAEAHADRKEEEVGLGRNAGATAGNTTDGAPVGLDAEDAAEEIRILDPKDLRFVTDLRGRLCLVLRNELCYFDVKPVRAFPLSFPDGYVELHDVRGKRIGLLVGMEGLSETDRQLLGKALARRYFAPQILRILRIRESYGLYAFDVETDRGPCGFTIRSPNSDIRHIPPTRYRFTDVHGITYDLPDISILDDKSRAILMDIL